MERAQKGKLASAEPRDKKKKGAKNTKYNPKPTAEEQTLAGRRAKLLGQAAAFRKDGREQRDAKRRDRSGKGALCGRKSGPPASFKSPEAVVFEGNRANPKNRERLGLKFKGSANNRVKKPAVKKDKRSQRSTAYREKRAKS